MLDNKECFMLWVELGTLYRVMYHLERKKKLNPHTGKPFSFVSIWFAAMRWVLDNPEEARQIYVEYGSPFTDEQWNKWLVSKACYINRTSKSRMRKWLVEHDLVGYKDVYDRRYPNLFIKGENTATPREYANASSVLLSFFCVSIV